MATAAYHVKLAQGCQIIARAAIRTRLCLTSTTANVCQHAQQARHRLLVFASRAKVHVKPAMEPSNNASRATKLMVGIYCSIRCVLKSVPLGMQRILLRRHVLVANLGATCATFTTLNNVFYVLRISRCTMKRVLQTVRRDTKQKTVFA